MTHPVVRPGMQTGLPGTAQLDREFTVPHETGQSREVSPGVLLASEIRALRQEMIRQARSQFDISHPVDEYISSPGLPSVSTGDEVPPPYTSGVLLQRTWDLPERIESVIVTLPVGCTSAILKLADRWINVFPNQTAAAALVNSYTYVQHGLGIILNQDDDRLLLMTGNLTAGPVHFELMGFAHEIYGNN